METWQPALPDFPDLSKDWPLKPNVWNGFLGKFSVFQPQPLNLNLHVWSLNNLAKGTKNSVYIVVSESQAPSDLLHWTGYVQTLAHSGGFCLQDR